MPITEQSMPRLHSLLRHYLTALEAADVQPFLSTQGGPEAFLVDDHQLVIGAGALSCCGPTELAFLVALALALGGAGTKLAQPGAIEGFEDAAGRAFDSVPASLAACRVLLQLDERVRGVDPANLDLTQILRTSRWFPALAERALTRL